MTSSAALVLGGGAMVAGAGVANVYVPGWPTALAGSSCGALFVGYLAVRRHELRPAGVAAWSSFVLMTVATSVWGVYFVATMPVSTLTRALAWAALALVAVSAPSALVQIREAWEPLIRTRWRCSPTSILAPWSRSHGVDPCALSCAAAGSGHRHPRPAGPSGTTPPSRSSFGTGDPVHLEA